MCDNGVRQYKREHMYPNISGTMHVHVYKIQQRSTETIPDLRHEVCVTTTKMCTIDLGSATYVGSVMIISNAHYRPLDFENYNQSTQISRIVTSTGNDVVVVASPGDVGTIIVSVSDAIT